MKEVEAANIVLGLSGEGDRFVIKWHGLKLKLKIKALSTRTLILISREIAQIPEVTTEKDVFPTIIGNADSLRRVCRSIAYATGTRFVRLVTVAIEELPLKDIQALWKIVIKQSDPSSFFFIMVSAKGMNQLKTNKEQP